MPSDATHPTSAQSILKPEYIVYTMYAIYKKKYAAMDVVEHIHILNGI